MFILKLGHIIDILVNDDPQAIRLIMSSDLLFRNRLRHSRFYCALSDDVMVHRLGLGLETKRRRWMRRSKLYSTDRIEKREK